MVKAKECAAFLRQKYPQWAQEKMVINDEGHQNLVIIIGDRFVIRFPRNREQNSFQLEHMLLPKLKGSLSIPVPDFIFSSKPGDETIYAICPIIEGICLYDYMFDALAVKEKNELAKNLGTFLTELHMFSLDPWKDHFPESRKLAIQRWKSKWEYVYQQLQLNLFPLIDEKKQTRIRQYFESYFKNPANFSFRPCLIHGDLKYKHLLYNWKDKRLAGIIDFGNMELGDPAYDFEELLVEYGEEFVKQVVHHYNVQMDVNFFERIRFYSVAMRFADFLSIKRRGEGEMTDQLMRLKLMLEGGS